MNFSSLDHPTPSEDASLRKMTLTEYLTFCDDMLRLADPEKVRKQKEWEEQIERPFRIEGKAQCAWKGDGKITDEDLLSA